MGPILYLTYDGLTDSLGMSQVLPYLLGAEAKGHHFHIISFEKKDRFERGRAAIEAVLKGRNLVWHPLIYSPTPPIISTLYDVWQLRKLAFSLHNQHHFAAVHCRSYITSLVGEALSLEKGVPFIFDMRAFYADERVDGGLWNLSNPLFRLVFNFFKRKEKDFLTQAAHTVTLTERAKQIIHGWEIKGQPVRIEVIPCCADLGHFDYGTVSLAQTAEARKTLNLADADRVVVYLGSLGTWYMVDEMLLFYRQLMAQQPHYQFLIITHDDATALLAKADQLGIDRNKLIIRSATRAELPALLSVADVALFFIQPKFSKAGSSPTKHGELLGMGIPVICNGGVGDMTEIVTSTQSGILLNQLNSESFDKAIEQLPEILTIPKSKLRAAAFKYYSLTDGVARYCAIYDKVTAS